MPREAVMRPRYLRRDWTRIGWGLGIAAALLGALWFAGQATVRAIRARERAAVLAEGDALLQLALAEGDSLARVADPLRVLAAQRDTVVIRTIARARAEASAPMPPASDTTALVTAVRSCRAALDTLATACEVFRAQASAALDAATEQHEADVQRTRLQAQQLAAITRSRDAALTQLAGSSRWQAFERGLCAASVVTNVLQWRTR